MELNAHSKESAVPEYKNQNKRIIVIIIVIKTNFALEQAMKAQRRSRSVALLFL